MMSAESFRVEPGAPLPFAIDIAKKMIGMGADVIFFPRGQKGTKESGWQNEATRDLAVVERKTALMPHANVGVVGKPDGLWFFDDDQGILAEYETKYGKIQTYRGRSVSGGTHLYLKQTNASREMGNISGTDELGKETWSARVNNKYVVAAGSSAHPKNDPDQPETFYSATEIVPVIEAPDTFISFLKAKAAQKPKKTTTPQTGATGVKIPHGGIHKWMLTQAGELRHKGLDFEQLEPALQKLVDANCEHPIDTALVTEMARSICNSYPAGTNKDLMLTQTPQNQLLTDVVLPEMPNIPYPIFPEWILRGTSLYDNHVKPICDVNSRIPEFVWMPAFALLLNYLGMKVSVKDKKLIPNLYIILVGQKGRTKKSSCLNEAMAYFEQIGLLQQGSRDTKNAEGKTIVWTVGSPEGLGLEMNRTNCKNAVLMYDELSTLAKKMGIESSTLGQAILTMYESGKQSNGIKSKKESYNLDPGTYCFSLIAANTLKNFADNWAKLATGHEGMDDRFTLIVQPEVLPKQTPYTFVNTLLGAAKSRELIDKAIQQAVFQIDDKSVLAAAIEEIGDRGEIRAEKYALGFAVDLGLDSIDADCCERGIALVRYEQAVKKYLGTNDAQTRMAAHQLKIRQILERTSMGKMPKRDLQRKMNSWTYDTMQWNGIYFGLIKAGIIREEGSGNKGDPIMVQVLELIGADSDD